MSAEIQPYVRRVPPSTASCTPVERRTFLAKLAAMQRRGEISEVWTDAATEREARETGRFVVRYRRLREPRPRLPLYATLSAAALGGMVSVGVMLWHARHVLLAGAAAIVITGIIIVALLSAGHRIGCTGLHCPGCRG